MNRLDFRLLFHILLSFLYRCAICSQIIFKKNKRLRFENLERIHIVKKPFACLKCEKTFSWSGTFKEHARHHLPVQNVTSHLQIVVIWKSWKDPHRREVICLFEMWQDIQLEWHFQTACKPPLACSKCDKSFTDGDLKIMKDSTQ